MKYDIIIFYNILRWYWKSVELEFIRSFAFDKYWIEYNTVKKYNSKHLIKPHFFLLNGYMRKWHFFTALNIKTVPY